MIDCGDFIVTPRHYGPGTRQPRHAHQHSNVTIVTAGQIEEGSGGGEYCALASSVVVKAAGCEHDDRVGGYGARTLSIEFAPDSCFGRAIASRAWQWFEMPETVRAGIALQWAFARADRGALRRTAAALVETVAACVPPPRSTPRWIATVCRAIDERFAASIRFEVLARDLGLHPVYVSRAFRRHTGMSMTAYLRSVRLRHARHALATTRRGIAAIAAESGFADASHLCRTFSALLGITPARYRRLGA